MRWNNTDAKDNFLPQNHPVIVKHNDTNTFYLYPHLVMNERELTYSNHQEPHFDASLQTRESKSFQIDSTESHVRKHLKICSNEQKKMMFFYNETNPHSGLIGNTKQILYDYFQLVGPVKDSWFKVLMKDVELSEFLSAHIVVELEKSKKYDRDYGTAGEAPPSIATIASILERLTEKKNVSNCKYKSTVSDNLFQIKRRQLTGVECAVLEVLAQYAYIDYEISDL